MARIVERRGARHLAAPYKLERIRVWPRDETIRKLIKHPSGIAFRSEGSIEWPFDAFTKRRLQDGTVTREEPTETAPAPQPEPEPEPAPIPEESAKE